MIIVRQRELKIGGVACIFVSVCMGNGRPVIVRRVGYTPKIHMFRNERSTTFRLPAWLATKHEVVVKNIIRREVQRLLDIWHAKNNGDIKTDVPDFTRTGLYGKYKPPGNSRGHN